MYELKVTTRFAAAHQLQMVGEKCENLHGHNWKVEVYVCGEKLDAGGVLVDFGIVKKHVAAIIDEVDHKFLNELPEFNPDHGTPPSSERIAEFIARRLQAAIDNEQVRVARVSAWESEDACATFIC